MKILNDLLYIFIIIVFFLKGLVFCNRNLNCLFKNIIIVFFFGFMNFLNFYYRVKFYIMWFILIIYSWIEKNYFDKYGEVEVYRYFLDSFGVGFFFVIL